MTATYVVSGAASGIGAATTALLRARGHRDLVFVDGGTEALLHPLKPEGMEVNKLALGLMNNVASPAPRVSAMRRRAR